MVWRRASLSGGADASCSESDNPKSGRKDITIVGGIKPKGVGTVDNQVVILRPC